MGFNSRSHQNLKTNWCLNLILKSYHQEWMSLIVTFSKKKKKFRCLNKPHKKILIAFFFGERCVGLWIQIGPYGGMDLERGLIFGLGFTLILKRLWAWVCDFLDWVKVKINFNVGWSLEAFELDLKERIGLGFSMVEWAYVIFSLLNPERGKRNINLCDRATK